MSRHEIAAVNPAHKIIIGWDHPLLTFFIQVINRKREKEGYDDKFIYWAGLKPREIYEVEDLVRHARPYANIPYELRSTLYGDKDEGR